MSTSGSLGGSGRVRDLRNDSLRELCVGPGTSPRQKEVSTQIHEPQNELTASVIPLATALGESRCPTDNSRAYALRPSAPTNRALAPASPSHRDKRQPPHCEWDAGYHFTNFVFPSSSEVLG